MNFYKNNKYYIILFAVFSLLVYVEYSKPKPIDWSVSYSSKDKIPYGAYILRHELKSVFPEKQIIDNKESYFQFFKKKKIEASILFITNSFDPNKIDLQLILNHAKEGNSVFVAADYFNKSFSDSLGFKNEINFDFLNTDSVSEMSFTNSMLSKKGYFYKKAFSNAIFNHLDSSKTTILGKNRHGVNFVKIEYGKGTVFVHLNPLVFSNFNMFVSSNFEYPFKALSYLPYNKIVWDEYYKPNNTIYAKTTPLYFILETESLRYAWYILILALVLFLLFEGKRRQRIIPVIEPPRNTSLEFIETVGKLYYHKASHKDLAEKKFKYFAEFLRSNYYLAADKFSTEHYMRIAEKTGVNKVVVENIFNYFRAISQKASITETELFGLNNEIEKFYKKCR